jgi:hypothetical protein
MREKATKMRVGNAAASPKPAWAHRGILQGVGVLLAFLLLGYGNIVFSRQSLVATSNYHPFDYRSTQQRTGGLVGPAYLNWHDQGATWWQWEPAAQFFSHALRAGRLPQWDPSISCGQNSHVQVLQTQYFPPYLVLLLTGNSTLGRDVYYLSMLFLSGFCCFLLLHRNGLHVLSASLMGALYMFTGAVTQNLNSMMGQSYLVLPLMVLATDWLLAKPTWRRVASAAGLYALATLSSFLPIVISGFLIVGIQILAHVISKAKVDWRLWLAWIKQPGAKVISALALGIGLTSFLLIPVQLASRRDPFFLQWYSKTGFQSLRFDTLLTLVSPILSYDVWQTADAASLLFPRGLWDSQFFYVGLTPLLLILLLRPRHLRQAPGLLLFFAIASAFLLTKMLGLPPAQWLAYLPVFSSLHIIPYFCGALTLALCGLAAFGLESLMKTRSSRAEVAFLSVGLIAFLGLLFRFAATHQVNPKLTPILLAGVSARFVLELARVVLVSGGLILVVALRNHMNRRLLGGLVLALIGLELLPLAHRQRYERADMWSHPPDYVKFLQADHGLFRVHGAHDMTLTPNVFQGLGLQAITSRNAFNEPRYSTLLRRYFEVPLTQFDMTSAILPKVRVVLDILNVKYLVLFAPSPPVIEELKAHGMELARQDGLFEVFRNPTSWPRAYLANRILTASTSAQALEMVATLRPGESVLEQAVDVQDPPAGGGEARVTRYEENEVVVHTQTQAPRVLVLGDNIAPGWSATVNGRETPLMTANYTFRAVVVPAGQATVIFRYRTPGLIAGMTLTTFCLMLALWLWYRKDTAPTNIPSLQPARADSLEEPAFRGARTR